MPHRAFVALMILLAAFGTVAALDRLEEKVIELGAEGVPICRDVETTANGQKRVVLFYSRSVRSCCIARFLGLNGGTKRQKMRQLLPLDIPAFVDRQLAKTGDELEVQFFDHHLMAIINTQEGERIYYNLPIHERTGGGIGYVRLSEATQETKISFVRPEIGVQAKANAKESLYYVRVPITLFAKLDGDAFKAKTGEPLSSYGLGQSSVGKSVAEKMSLSSYPLCMLVNPSSGESRSTFSFAIPLVPYTHKRFYLALAEFDHASSGAWGRHGAHSDVPNPTGLPFSNVQYLVVAKLFPSGRFNSLEPSVVDRHGRLAPKQVLRKTTSGDGNEVVELKFDKSPTESTLVTFPIRVCEVIPHANFQYLRTVDEVGKGAGEECINGAELGISYRCEFDDDNAQ